MNFLLTPLTELKLILTYFLRHFWHCLFFFFQVLSHRNQKLYLLNCLRILFQKASAMTWVWISYARQKERKFTIFFFYYLSIVLRKLWMERTIFFYADVVCWFFSVPFCRSRLSWIRPYTFKFLFYFALNDWHMLNINTKQKKKMMMIVMIFYM